MWLAFQFSGIKTFILWTFIAVAVSFAGGVIVGVENDNGHRYTTCIN